MALENCASESLFLFFRKEEGRSQSVFFYIADEAGGKVTLFPDQSGGSEHSPFAGGHSEDFGEWELHAKYPV